VRAGYPLQSALDDLDALADPILPPGIDLIPLGEAATLEEASRDAMITYAIALLVVFLVLVAQFESLTSGLVVMLVLPFGLAAAVRLRRIVMTLISMVFGALPLILSSGPGAEARHAIGWVVFAGLGLAAAFTLYLTPVAYRMIAPWSKPRAANVEGLERELEAVGEGV